MRSSEDLFAKCERDGEETVRKRMAEDVYCTRQEKPIVEEWLRLKEKERSLSLAAIRDEREMETSAIAKEANRLAAEANLIAREEAAAASHSARWAKYAAIIAAIAAIASSIITIIIALLTKKS